MIAALVLLAAGLDPLLAKIAGTYGGEKKLLAIKAVRQTGTLESMRGSGRVLRAFTPQNMLRVEIEREGAPVETRVLAGELAWNDLEQVDGPARAAMVLQHARLDLPALLFRSRALLVDLGELSRGGKKLHGIGIPLRGGLLLAVSVDPKSGRIVRSEGALESGMRFTTDYSDFRRVDGVLFAFVEETSVSGQSTGKTTLDRIELLPELPASTFRPRQEPF